jgi:hypothetical protein
LSPLLTVSWLAFSSFHEEPSFHVISFEKNVFLEKKNVIGITLTRYKRLAWVLNEDGRRWDLANIQYPT